MGCLYTAEDEYIYQLRVEQADRNRRIYAEAQLKEVSTQTWADLTARASTYEVFDDDEDWKIRMQALCGKSEARTILLSSIEGSSEIVECKQAKKMRPTGEKVFRPIYSSSAVGSASLSSFENKTFSFSHVPEPIMREFKTSHYNARMKPSWMGKDLS